MPSRKPETIKDEALRALMAEADRVFEDGDATAAVRLYGNAYLMVLNTFPEVGQALKQVLDNPIVRAGLESGSTRNAPYMWPRYGAKLEFDDHRAPSIRIDRKHMSFSETVQYQEFMYDLIRAAESHTVHYDPGAVRPAQ